MTQGMPGVEPRFADRVVPGRVFELWTPNGIRQQFEEKSPQVRNAVKNMRLMALMAKLQQADLDLTAPEKGMLDSFRRNNDSKYRFCTPEEGLDLMGDE